MGKVHGKVAGVRYYRPFVDFSIVSSRKPPSLSILQLLMRISHGYDSSKMFLTKNPINQDFQETCAFSEGQVSWLVLLKILKKNQETKKQKTSFLIGRAGIRRVLCAYPSRNIRKLSRSTYQKNRKEKQTRSLHLTRHHDFLHLYILAGCYNAIF